MGDTLDCEEESEEVTRLRHEVELLQQRVLELQQKAASYQENQSHPADAAMTITLAEREELLAEAERLTNFGTWVWNVESNDVHWSPQLYRILGYDLDTQASTEAFFDAVHPEDRARIQETSAESVRSGITRTAEFRIRRPNGDIREAVMSGAMLFDSQGRLRRIVGSVRDVTETLLAARSVEQINQQLEEAQHIGQLGSWHLHRGSEEHLEWSAEFRRILGVDPQVTPTTELFLSRMHPDDWNHITLAQERILREGGTCTEQGRVMRANGELRYVRLKGIAKRREDGHVESIHGTMQDITEQVELQNRLLHSQKMEAVGRLAGGIAHDFNNLLTVITGNLDLLEADLVAPSAELADAQRALVSAQALTQRLLTFGRKARLERKLIDPNQLIQGTVQLLKRLLSDQVGMVCELQQDIPPIWVDPVSVEQALINLVVNARDAMPSGGTVKLISRTLLVGDRSMVELSVADNGPGLASEVKKRVFEPFFTTKEGSKGTGLGLATVLGTVEQHGGDVMLESEPGHGATFRLRFPAEQPLLKERAETAAANEKQGSLTGATILVIEDEPMVASVIARTLEKSGHCPLLAQDAEQAIELWKKRCGEIALVICDVVMPQMRGPQLLAKLKEHRTPNTLFVTGYSEEMLNDSLGAPVLTKPFTPKQLAGAVTRSLSSFGKSSAGEFRSKL